MQSIAVYTRVIFVNYNPRGRTRLLQFDHYSHGNPSITDHRFTSLSDHAHQVATKGLQTKVFLKFQELHVTW